MPCSWQERAENRSTLNTLFLALWSTIPNHTTLFSTFEARKNLLPNAKANDENQRKELVRTRTCAEKVTRGSRHKWPFISWRIRVPENDEKKDLNNFTFSEIGGENEG